MIGIESFFGLFSTIDGGTVRNLIIDNAHGTYSNNSDIVNSRLVGILAGGVRENSSIQNIIIRNSKIEGASTTFNQNGKWLVIGGAIGKIINNNNNYKFENIAANVKIDLRSLNVTNQDRVNVGGVIAECQNNVKTCVNNLYAQNTIDVPSVCQVVGSVI